MAETKGRIAARLRWGALFGVAVPAAFELSTAMGALARGVLDEVPTLGLVIGLGGAVLAVATFVAIASGRLTLARVVAGAFAASEVLQQAALARSVTDQGPIRGAWISVAVACVPLALLLVGPERRRSEGERLFGTIGWLIAGAIGAIAIADGLLAEGLPSGSLAALVLVAAFVAALASARRLDIMFGIAVGCLPTVLLVVVAPSLLSSWLTEETIGPSGVKSVLVSGSVGTFAAMAHPVAVLFPWVIAVAVSGVGLARARGTFRNR
jgi:hypothetical protein